MKSILAFLLVALLVTPVFAGENPGVRLFMTADSEDYVDYIDVPGTTQPVPFYLVADCLETGATAVAMTLTNTVPGWQGGAFTYLPGALTIGGVNDPAGFSLAWADCEYPDPITGFLVIGTFPWCCTGPGTWVITPHPTETRKLTDCDKVADQYCVYQNVGVGVTAPAGDEGCECEVSPVEDSTWGTIKSLYK